MQEYTRFEQVGNLTAEPVLFPARQDGGDSRCTITIASNPTWMDNGERKQGAATFITVTYFGRLAENVSATFRKGMRVIVKGNIKPNKYTKDGVEIFGYNFVGTEAAPDLAWATAEVTRNAARGSQGASPAADVRDAQEEPAF